MTTRWLSLSDLAVDLSSLRLQLLDHAQLLGFSGVGVSAPQLEQDGEKLQRWWQQGYGGNMQYLVKHGSKRWRPEELVPGTLRVISLSMSCWPPAADSLSALADPDRAYIARYALGRDYHKVMRPRLAKLATWLYQTSGIHQGRAFVDSAPVLEKRLAEQAGIGWIGKHTLLLSRQQGSALLLGEIYTNIPLPIDIPVDNHCGSCQACMEICPTRALRAPYVLDARLCISYLTIESREDIPESLRPALGNRIFGCDDCQLVCPWNRYARTTQERDQQIRHGLHAVHLNELAYWDEALYEHKTEGSALRRIGYTGFMRNIAVGLGNARPLAKNLQAIAHLQRHPADQVQRHADWAARNIERRLATAQHAVCPDPETTACPTP